MWLIKGCYRYKKLLEDAEFLSWEERNSILEWIQKRKREEGESKIVFKRRKIKSLKTLILRKYDEYSKKNGKK